MAEGTNVGGAKLTISADSGPAEKAVAGFFQWFEKAGQKATELATKVSSVVEKSQELGTKGANSTKNMVSQYQSLKGTVEKANTTIGNGKKIITDLTSSGTRGYQTLANKITNSNSTISSNTKQTFGQMKSDAKLSYSEMTKDSKAMNQALVISMKDSLSNLKSSFGDLKNGFKTLGSSLIDLIKRPIETIRQFPTMVRQTMSNLAGFFQSGFARAKDAAIAQLNKIKDGFLNIPTRAKQAVNQVKDVLVTGFNTAVNATASVISKIGNGLASLPSKAGQVASNFKNAFVNGIKSIPSTIGQMAGNIKNSFVNGIRDIPNKASNIWASLKNGVRNLPQTTASAASTIKEKLSSGFQSVLAKARSVFPGVKKEVQDGVEKPSASAKTAVGDLAAAFGLVQVAGKAFGMLKDSIGGAVSRIDTLKNADRSFENMGFKAKETKKAMDGLSEGIDGLPTPLDEAVSGLQMISASTQDVGRSQKIFNAMNDAILGFGGGTEQVNNAVVQLSQGFSNGVIDGGTWNSMMNSQMGPTLNAMAKLLGKTTGELKEGLSEGTISVEEFQDTLIKLDEEGGGGLKSLKQIAQDSTKGISTSAQNMKTAVVRGMANVITAFDEMLKKVTGTNIADTLSLIGKKAETGLKGLEGVFKKITPFVKKLFDMCKPLLPVLKGVLAAFMAFGGLVTVISTVSHLTGIISQFMAAAAANPFVLIIAAIVGLIVVFKQVYAQSESFRGIIDGLAEPFKRLFEVVKIVGEAIATMFTEGPGEKMSQLHEELSKFLPQELVASIWEKIASFKKAIDQVKAIFEIVSAAISGNVDRVNELSDKYAEILGGKVVQALKDFLNKLSEVLEPIKKAMEQFKNALKLRLDEGDYVGAIELIGRVVPKLAQKIVEGIPQLLGAGGKLLLAIADGMGLNIPQLISKIPGWINRIIDGFLGWLLKMQKIGWEILNNILAGIDQYLPKLLPIAGKVIGFLVNGLMSLVGKLAEFGLQAIVNMITGLLNALPKLISIAGKIVSFLGQMLAKYLPIIVQKGMDIIVKLAQGIAEKLPSLASKALQIVLSLANKIAENFPTIIKKGWELVTNLAKGIVERLPAILAAALKLVFGLIGKLIEHLPDIIATGVKLVAGLIKGLWEFTKGLGKFILGFFKALYDGFKKVDWGDIGKEIINGIVSGITKAVEKAKDAISDVADGIKGWFEEKLGIASPSKVMIESASWVPKGIEVGIKRGIPVVRDAVGMLTDTMEKAVKDSAPVGLTDQFIQTENYSMPDMSKMVASMQQASAASNEVMSDSSPQLLQTAMNAASGMVAQFSTVAPEMMTQGAQWIQNFILGWTMNEPLVLQQMLNSGVLWVQNLLMGWNNTAAQITVAVQGLCNTILFALQNQQGSFIQIGQAWGQQILAGWNTLSGTIVSAVNNFAGQVVTALRNQQGTIGQIGAIWIQNLINGWNGQAGQFLTSVTTFCNNAVNLLRSHQPYMSQIGRAWLQQVQSGWNSMVNEFSNTISSFTNRVIALLKGFNGAMQQVGANWLQNNLNGWNSVVNAYITNGSGFVNRLIALLKSYNDQMFQNGRSWMQQFLNGWIAVEPTFTTRIRTFCERTMTTLLSFLSQLNQIGRQWLQRLLDGWNSLYSQFINRASQLGDDTVSKLRSKDTDFYNAGKYLIENFIKGIDAMKDGITTVVNGISNAMVAAIGKGVNGVASGINHILGQVESDKKISNWEVPKYARGTDGHPKDGPAVINDQKGSKYKELVQNPDGSSFIAEGRNRLVWLQKGAKVLNATMTDRVMKARKTLSTIPHYEDGIGDFDEELFDLLDDQGIFDKMINERTKLDGIKEPWLNMTQKAMKIMRDEAYPWTVTQVEEMFGGGDFDGDIYGGGLANANGVYTYLVEIAEKIIKRFGNGFYVSSGFRPGHAHHHGMRQAIDLAIPGAIGTKLYTQAAEWAFDKFPRQVGYYITNGIVRDRMGYTHGGTSGKRVAWGSTDHDNHIHISGMLGAGNVFSADTSGHSKAGASASRDWAGQIKKAAAQMKEKISSKDLNDILAMINMESGGRQVVTQQVDDMNSRSGNHAQGLLQYVPSTFRSYAVKGFGNINSGYHQLLAFFNDRNWRRAISNWYATLARKKTGWGPVGPRRYENGGWITQEGLFYGGEGNKPEIVVPLTKPKRAMELIGEAMTFMFGNGSNLLENAKVGLNGLASNLALSAMDFAGYDTSHMYGSVGMGSAMELQEIIELLETNNYLLAEMAKREATIDLDGRTVGKMLEPHLSAAQKRKAKINDAINGRG